jgi:hypothetical protein
MDRQFQGWRGMTPQDILIYYTGTDIKKLRVKKKEIKN